MPILAKPSTILQMHTAILGTDFKSVSLDVLEKLYFDHERIKAFHKELPKDVPVSEWVILSTCNRMEIYFACEDVDYTFKWLIRYLANYCKVDAQILEKVSYKMNCHEAVNHLFHVAAGTESMVYGESEILGQIKDAYFHSAESQMTGPYMNKVFQLAISAGKRVRDETAISKGSYSISSIAVEAIRKRLNNDTNISILLIGVGIMTQRALKKLQALGYNNVYVTNRTQEKAEVFAQEEELTVIPFREWKSKMPEMDVLYFATRTAVPLIYSDDLVHLEKKPIIVDVGVPRNVESDCSKYSTLISIDSLEDVAKETQKNRLGEKDHIDQILDQVKSDFQQWYSYKQAHV